MSDVLNYALLLGLVGVPVILLILAMIAAISRIYAMQSLVLATPFS